MILQFKNNMDEDLEKIKRARLNEIMNELQNRIKTLNESNFGTFVSEGVSVIDFWAPWCAPCHILSPLIEDLAEKYTKVKFGKVNGDENMRLLYQYNITGLPTVLFFKNGMLADRSVGVVPENVLEEKLKWLL
ncbi:thioredoxin [Picrophilus oshimae DSM 9789]|uniref:Thioredoxin n=2 Tax=Picrophilus oshimae TaxID=46632 RepID=Q6L2U6_PICTO|nr:thioredoxin [Picrophilus oshimae DSM 9789]